MTEAQDMMCRVGSGQGEDIPKVTRKCGRHVHVPRRIIDFYPADHGNR